MTSGEPSTGPAKAKIIGFGLIGVGAIAGVVGIVTLVSGGGASNSAQPLPPEPGNNPPVMSLTQNPPAESAVVPPATSQVAPSPATQDSPPPAPPQGTQNQDVPVGSGNTTTKILVRVYNNSTISGLAHRAAEDFRSSGYEVPEVGNYSAGLIPTTTIYFRPGTVEEQQAQEMAVRFGARAEPRFEGIQDATPGLIAIITNDYKGHANTK
ncbi:LytR C-terminal domain-containing protein [Saccharopolyspora sp. ASAGF58]|uniref:LytR C-terminal domain-containing protein n=1 Tax=Saccharopolyspora sp. ASAGF58 TaxID=2719023 RepID=UPI00143FCAEF|nr:LytR C-terminal domain-containing protein [Saccharopolyspora sp. ASAGF58]QIZ35658.1 LytR family transcriptional regulator [Saccharopolyspora sp. ASAGF58]